jgi:hypothetical protein
VLRAPCLHIFFRSGEVLQVLVWLGNAENGDVLPVDVEPESLNEFDNLVTLFGLEAVIVLARHVHSKLVLGVMICGLAYTIKVSDADYALHFLLMDVEEALVSDH